VVVAVVAPVVYEHLGCVQSLRRRCCSGLVLLGDIAPPTPG
jgi:hypothetical protein